MALHIAISASAGDLQLPDLGASGGGLVTAAQEYDLGQRWQRMFRAQVSTTQDPFIQEYIENLTRTLANYSDLEDKRLDILVVDNPALNAFAVPGGVIGVNTGLFNYSQTEEQFASILAHEIAHLSQRHFARNIEERRDKQIPNIAAMLASILILATAGGDAGIAALSVTQAAAIDSQLRFSRQMEQEADRIGMATMVRADLDPYAMPAMFEQMLHAARFRQQPPEFLITHPLTESRISDSKLRAQQYDKKQVPSSKNFELIKTRAQLHNEKNLNHSIRSFEGRLRTNSGNPEIPRYGLALAQMKNRNLPAANKNIDLLLDAEPNNFLYITTKAQIEAEEKKFDSAIKRLKAKTENHPSSHPLNIVLAEILMKAGRYAECEALLLAHSERRPKDEYVWYLLAEAHGLAGHIYEVHTARTEYFMLNGMYKNAENHVRHALKLVDKDRHTRAKLEQKLKEIQRFKREEERL